MDHHFTNVSLLIYNRGGFRVNKYLVRVPPTPGEHPEQHVLRIRERGLVSEIQASSEVPTGFCDVRRDQDVVFGPVDVALQRDLRVRVVMNVALTDADYPRDVLHRVDRILLNAQEVRETVGAETVDVRHAKRLLLLRFDVLLGRRRYAFMRDLKVVELPTADRRYHVLVDFHVAFDAARRRHVQDHLVLRARRDEHHDGRSGVVRHERRPFIREFHGYIAEFAALAVALEKVRANDQLLADAINKERLIDGVRRPLYILLTTRTRTARTTLAPLRRHRRTIRAVVLRPRVDPLNDRQSFRQLIQPVHCPDVNLPRVRVYREVVDDAIVGGISECLVEIVDVARGRCRRRRMKTFAADNTEDERESWNDGLRLTRPSGGQRGRDHL